jgi:hypothetical protein
MNVLKSVFLPPILKLKIKKKIKIGFKNGIFSNGYRWLGVFFIFTWQILLRYFERENYKKFVPSGRQFHQHFTCAFFIWKYFGQLFFSHIWELKFFWRQIIGKKFALKMLMKLTPGLILPSCLRRAFMHADPCSLKFQLSWQYLFALLGSSGVKFFHKNVDEIDLGWDRRVALLKLLGHYFPAIHKWLSFILSYN